MLFKNIKKNIFIEIRDNQILGKFTWIKFR